MLGFFQSECMPKHNTKGSILGSILQHSPALGTLAMDTTGCQRCQEVALGHTHTYGAVSLWRLPCSLRPLGWGTWRRQQPADDVIPLPFPTSGPFPPRPTHSA